MLDARNADNIPLAPLPNKSHVGLCVASILFESRLHVSGKCLPLETDYLSVTLFAFSSCLPIVIQDYGITAMWCHEVVC